MHLCPNQVEAAGSCVNWFLLKAISHVPCTGGTFGFEWTHDQGLMSFLVYHQMYVHTYVHMRQTLDYFRLFQVNYSILLTKKHTSQEPLLKTLLQIMSSKSSFVCSQERMVFTMCS